MQKVFLTFTRTKQKRSKVLATARIQPFCKKHNINIGWIDGLRRCPRKNTERDIAFDVYKNHFCVFWKSNGIIFNKATEELKLNLKVVDVVISDKHFKNIIKQENIRKKDQPQLIHMIVYDLETFNTDRAIPYATRTHRLT